MNTTDFSTLPLEISIDAVKQIDDVIIVDCLQKMSLTMVTYRALTMCLFNMSVFKKKLCLAIKMMPSLYIAARGTAHSHLRLICDPLDTPSANQ